MTLHKVSHLPGKYTQKAGLLREQVRCVPDRYLLLIVETIEEAGTGTLR